MKHVISQRLERKNGYKRILDIFIARELAKRSSRFNEKRGMPIAVFGNDWIGINITLKGLFEEEHLKDLNHLLINLDINVSNSNSQKQNNGARGMKKSRESQMTTEELIEEYKRLKGIR